jgi:hypothetical protein
MAILNAQHLSPAGGFFEVQRQYNWSLEIALDDAGDQVLITQGLESFTGPDCDVGEIELNYGNETRYVAGRAKFQEAPLVVRDFVDIGVFNALMKWFRQVYNSETGAIGLARNYKKNADLVMVAPDQSVARAWKLIGVWPRRMHHGDFSMENVDKVRIECLLRYDRAIPSFGLSTGLGGINVGILTPPLT